MATEGATKSLADMDITRCMLCSEFFTDPLLLPCLHTFCSKCLRESSSQNVSDMAQETASAEPVGTNIVCPRCLAPSLSALESLPASAFLAKAADLQRLETERKAKSLTCSACSRQSDGGPNATKVAAVAYCAECDDTLCQACYDAHRKLKITEPHQLVELADNEFREKVESILKATVVPTCKLHRNQPLSLYCRDAGCLNPICASCALKHHRNHDFVDMDEVAAEHRETLSSSVEAIATDLERVENELKQVKSAKQCLDDSMEATEKQISDRVDELKQLVLKRRQDLQELVNYMHLDQMNRVGQVEKKLKRMRETTENVIAVSRELASRGSDAEVCSLAKRCLDRIQQLLDTPDMQLPKPVQLAFLPSTKLESAIDFQPAKLFGTVETIHETKFPNA